MILASALLLAVQEPIPPRVHHDHVAVIVNDDIIRMREISRELAREARRRPLTTERERAILLNRVTSQFVENLLRRQAGQDLGLDPKLIQLQIDGHNERFIENVGSILDASEILRQADMDSSEARYMWESQLYDTIWQESVVGKGPDRSGRIVSNRYVRPGEIYARYQEYVDPPPWLPRPNPAEIGGIDERAVLREINIDGRSTGAENAFARCQEAHAQALEGVDLEEIHALVGGPSPEPRPFGMYELNLGFPEIIQWLEKAQPGDISPILPYAHEGRIAGYHFVKLEERLPAQIPPFENADVQSRIKKQILEERDTQKINEALTELFQRAYIWPPELATPPEGAPAAAQDAP